MWQDNQQKQPQQDRRQKADETPLDILTFHNLFTRKTCTGFFVPSDFNLVVNLDVVILSVLRKRHYQFCIRTWGACQQPAVGPVKKD
jgi:hypothetical protein